MLDKLLTMLIGLGVLLLCTAVTWVCIAFAKQMFLMVLVAVVLYCSYEIGDAFRRG